MIKKSFHAGHAKKGLYRMAQSDTIPTANVRFELVFGADPELPVKLHQTTLYTACIYK